MNALATRLVTTGLTAVASIGARRVAEQGWRSLRGEEPPTDGEVEDDRQLREVLLWAATTTIAMIIAQRIASKLAQRLTD